jgi:hypothetical protein
MNNTLYFNQTMIDPVDLCMREENVYSSVCLIKTICPQINSWIIRTGLIIIISYILFSWLLWWFFKYGYKALPAYDNEKYIHKFFGNFNHKETRIYWDTWIRARLSKLMLGYIIIIVYLNI